VFSRFKRAPWWVHVLSGVGLLAVFNIGLLAVAGVLFLDYTRERGPLKSEIPDQSEVTGQEAADLASRFAPILRYDSRELFFPISRAAYVGLTQLKEQEGRFVRTLRSSMTEDTLPESLGTCVKQCLLFLDIKGIEPDPPKHSERAYDVLENALVRRGATPRVYFHVTRYDDSGETAVQYWFLYFFNFRLNEHESDWEQVTVRLDEDGKPIGVFYSAHEGGHIEDWKDIRRRGVHPVAFPALGSHANYFQPGRHRVAVGCRRVIGSIQRCIRGRTVLVDVADGRGRQLDRGSYSLTELTGPLYAGSYGSGNYVALSRRPDVLSDPRIRTAWNDPLRRFR
jgi:Vacuolar protein sorting-associated protein 62